VILHLPHSSRLIPAGLRDQILLSDRDLAEELTLMTDAFTDEIFACPKAAAVRFPFSRLIVDVERFSDESEEPRSRMGMGVIYTRTAHGGEFRRRLQPEEQRALMSLYEAHHQALSARVAGELEQSGRALIIDCHSFPSRPLPCDLDKTTPRPQFCLGTDPTHTPEALRYGAFCALVVPRPAPSAALPSLVATLPARLPHRPIRPTSACRAAARPFLHPSRAAGSTP
jgi:N-formylglutamate deformylase